MFRYDNTPCYYMTRTLEQTYIIPQWVYVDLKSKFPEYSELIKSENISIMKISLKHTNEPQLVLILNLQGLDGIFILYDNVDGNYRQVYEKRGLITSFQTHWDTNLVIAVRLGKGTGYWIDQYYVIRFTSKGWIEVWSNYAQYVKILPEIEPGVQIIGTVSFDTPDHLNYSTITRSNITANCNHPIDINYSFNFFSYNYTSESFT